MRKHRYTHLCKQIFNLDCQDVGDVTIVTFSLGVRFLLVEYVWFKCCILGANLSVTSVLLFERTSEVYNQVALQFEFALHFSNETCNL